MFRMFASFFQALTTLFTAANKGAQAIDALADVALDTSHHYRDTRRAEMAKSLKLIEND